jgi:hypothetical protein
MKVEADIIASENNFIELHRAQLKSSGLPESHWISLFYKLKDEVLTKTETFKIWILSLKF